MGCLYNAYSVLSIRKQSKDRFIWWQRIWCPTHWSSCCMGTPVGAECGPDLWAIDTFLGVVWVCRWAMCEVPRCLYIFQNKYSSFGEGVSKITWVCSSEILWWLHHCVSDRIHGTSIFTYIWLMFMVNVGEYRSPMDPMRIHSHNLENVFTIGTGIAMNGATTRFYINRSFTAIELKMIGGKMLRTFIAFHGNPQPSLLGVIHWPDKSYASWVAQLQNPFLESFCQHDSGQCPPRKSFLVY